MSQMYSALLPGQIRLLRLLPAEDENAPLKSQLFTLTFFESGRSVHPYDALSYVWGGNDKPRSLCISGHDMPVTENLYQALSKLRHVSMERILWIDAICINQGDEREKAWQICLMASIYAQASCVVVWLGKEADNSDQALEEIRAAGNQIRRDDISSESDEVIQTAVRVLLERPWFQRIWVLQEVASARHVTIKCGHTEVDGFAFALGLENTKGVMSDVAREINSIFCVTDLMRRSIFQPSFITKPNSERSSFDIAPLAELIDMYHSHKATVCHDKLYALLGMSSDKDLDKAGLLPEYQTPWHKVLHRLVNFILGTEVSVRTWDNEERAVIRGKGWTLGKVSAVERRDNRQYIEVMPRCPNTRKEWNRKRAYDKRHAIYRPDALIQCEDFNGCELDLPITATPIMEGDIFCLIEGASNPTIIRFCNDHFSIVAITVTMHPLTVNHEWSRYLRQRQLYTRDFLLIWDWENSPTTLRCLAEPEGCINIEGNLPQTPENRVSDDLDKAIRMWNASLVLDSSYGETPDGEDLDQLNFGVRETTTRPLWDRLKYERDDSHEEASDSEVSGGEDCEAGSTLAKAIQYCTASLGLQPGWIPKQRGLSQLSWASRNGYQELAEMLISRGAEANLMEEDGMTALSYAAEGGNLALVQLLLTRGAITDPENACTRNTPLSLAIMNGNSAIAELLLKEGAQIGLCDDNGRTPLSYAAEGGHDTLVQLLLAKGAQVDSGSMPGTPCHAAGEDGHANVRLADGTEIGVSNDNGRTPLSYAAERGHATVVQLLLAKGARSDLHDRHGTLPLSFAASNGHDAVVQSLIAGGANVNAKDADRWTPLSYAACRGHDAVVQLLLAQGAKVDIIDDGNTALMRAATNGHATVVELLSSKGAEVDITDEDGKTPLMHAAINGHAAVVESLLAQGAEVDLISKEGKTPLIYAVTNGHAIVVQLLSAQGARIDTTDECGTTSLMYAARGGHDAVVELLLSKGAEVDIADEDGSSALTYAAIHGHATVVQLLLAQGAKVDVPDRWGTTPLMYAALGNRHYAVVEILLSTGAEIGSSDKYGKTALWYAETDEVVQLLLAKGAKNEERDGHRPWYLQRRRSRDFAYRRKDPSYY